MKLKIFQWYTDTRSPNRYRISRQSAVWCVWNLYWPATTVLRFMFFSIMWLLLIACRAMPFLGVIDIDFVCDAHHSDRWGHWKLHLWTRFTIQLVDMGPFSMTDICLFLLVGGGWEYISYSIEVVKIVTRSWLYIHQCSTKVFKLNFVQNWTIFNRFE